MRTFEFINQGREYEIYKRNKKKNALRKKESVAQKFENHLLSAGE